MTTLKENDSPQETPGQATFCRLEGLPGPLHGPRKRTPILKEGVRETTDKTPFSILCGVREHEDQPGRFLPSLSFCSSSPLVCLQTHNTHPPKFAAHNQVYQQGRGTSSPPLGGKLSAKMKGVGTLREWAQQRELPGGTCPNPILCPSFHLSKIVPGPREKGGRPRPPRQPCPQRRSRWRENSPLPRPPGLFTREPSRARETLEVCLAGIPPRRAWAMVPPVPTRGERRGSTPLLPLQVALAWIKRFSG